MPNATKIEDHYEEAKELLPSQFYDKPFINAQLKAITDACQDVEDSFYDQLYIGRFLNNASGEDLDRIGNLFSVKRNLEELDEDYLRRINAEILRRNAEGTPTSVKRVMKSTTGLSNMRINEHFTGGVIVYGETLDSNYSLKGDEALYLKGACPVTTGSTVFGVSYSENYSNTLIPAELDVTYYNLIADDAGEDKNIVTGNNPESKNIVARSSSDVTLSFDSPNAELAEFSITTDQILVDPITGETTTLDMNTTDNFLEVVYEGIENDRAIPLDTVQITINSTVEQIQDAYNELPPP